MIKRMAALSLCLLWCMLLTACGVDDGLDPDNPVTLTLWHNYGGQMQESMDSLVDKFNNTVGRERGVIVSVVSISSSAALQEKLTMIAAGDPGAPAMPDITTCYPQTAVLLEQQGLLAPLDELFTAEELAGYLPRFIEEGRLADGKLYVFPIAKSTEVLFVNQTLFDRFAAATDVTLDDLATFEGIARAAQVYYDWTDAQTPDVPDDGKTFFMADSVFNVAQVGMKQLGGSLFDGETLALTGDTYRHIFDTLLVPAVQGGYALYDNYSSNLAVTGDILCSTGSTAGIVFYGTEINYPDNTREPVEYTVLPYPVFEGGQKIAVQRGNGMVVSASDAAKQAAAVLFLKWFTAPEQNLEFVASTGYLPVTSEAFADSMEQEIVRNGNVNIQKLLRAAITVHQEYDFLIPPVFDAYNTLKETYESGFLAQGEAARETYLALRADGTPAQEAYAQATQGLFEDFIAALDATG